ncbi:MAG: FprA family A-type flavoprotein [Alphaproteobacteria bacterium]|nr:FprA family A-type flavoprotein [Alphaproteobacteria bacterium]
MSQIVLFDEGGHRNILLPEQDAGAGVASNQHIVIDGQSALLLDPGGTKVYRDVFTAAAKAKQTAKLEIVFLSHQDPDIVAALNGWLMTTEARAVVSKLWHRFIPHFGSDKLVYSRVDPLPDEGTVLKLGGCELLVLPAHFLHSVGNFHLYDPRSKILYTGDLGASLGEDYREVSDLAAHIPLMEGFHRRYMSSNAALRAWLKMVRPLDIEIVAPQHGALMRGRPMIDAFFDWLEGLECGIDYMPDVFRVPA